MTEVFRTPDEQFEGLPDFDYPPRYREAGGLRLAHLDVGEGAPVVMLHGEPGWSFTYRRLIPPLRDAGHRCVVPDHAGFGRSDKPTDPAWYTLPRHIELTCALLDGLDLRDATLVCHDWGGPIGTAVALARPERVARIVVLDTALDPGELWMNEAWVRFREFVERTEDLPVGEMMRATCVRDPGAEVIAGYDAPYPNVELKVGVRALPLSTPRTRDPEAAAVTQLIGGLRADPRPVLVLWAKEDRFLTLASGQRLASAIGRRIDHVIEDAGHGLQEDQGPLVGKLIADWLGEEG